jgi:hypothetical protein
MRANLRKNAHQSPSIRIYGKFSANLCAKMVNFSVTVAPEKLNFPVFVSKNRNHLSEHFGGK